MAEQGKADHVYTDDEMMDALRVWAVTAKPILFDNIDGFRPMTAFQVLGALQLALRHPHFPESHVAAVRRTADWLVSKIAPEPGPLRQLALRGFDPQYDLEIGDG